MSDSPRISWGAVIMDLAVLGAAVYTHVWALLWLWLLTGGYVMKCHSDAEDRSR